MPRQEFVTRTAHPWLERVFLRVERVFLRHQKKLLGILSLSAVIGVLVGQWFLSKWALTALYILAFVTPHLPSLLAKLASRIRSNSAERANVRGKPSGIREGKLVVGEEGIWISGHLRARPISFAALEGVEATEEAVVLRLRDARPVKVRIMDPSRVKGTIDEAVLRFEQREPARPIPALLQEGKPFEEWTADVRGLTSPAGKGYRAPELPPESLVAVAQDPKSPAQMRVAAALALSNAPVHHAQVRVAIDRAADPELAEALELALTGKVNEPSTNKA